MGGDARCGHPQRDRIDPEREIRKRGHPIGTGRYRQASNRSSGVWNNPCRRSTRRERAPDEHQQPDGHRDRGLSWFVATAQPGSFGPARCRVTREIDHLNGDRPARSVGPDKLARSYSLKRLPGDLEAECPLRRRSSFVPAWGPIHLRVFVPRARRQHRTTAFQQRQPRLPIRR